jgi:hypothetical protein
MFKSVNCGHTHATVVEARACVFRPTPPPPPRPFAPPAPPVDPDAWKARPGSMTRKQHGYLEHQLGATERMMRYDNGRGKWLSCNDASKLIDDLKAGRVTVPADPQDLRYITVENNPKLAFVDGLIDFIDSGYYAVRRQEGDPITFMRIARPKTGKAAGAIKVQTQHGPALETRAIKWPSGRWSVFTDTILDSTMLLVADTQTAAMLYAEKIGRCMRCNTELTDDRSRHYGIGPDCEKVWTWVIPRVDEERGAYVPGLVS